MLYRVFNIKYDTDGDDAVRVDLPITLEVDVDLEGIGNDELEEYLSERITIETSCCHEGFDYENLTFKMASLRWVDEMLYQYYLPFHETPFKQDITSEQFKEDFFNLIDYNIRVDFKGRTSLAELTDGIEVALSLGFEWEWDAAIDDTPEIVCSFEDILQNRNLWYESKPWYQLDYERQKS